MTTGASHDPRLRALPVLGAAAIALSILAGNAALAAPRVLDDFAYPDSAAARAAWTALGGSPEVEMADSGPWGAERAMRLPLNFTVQPDRCYWDRGVTLDLSAHREFALEIFVPDPGAVPYFTLYFRSGAGWFGHGASITRPGWQTLTFSVMDFVPEGTPAGWDQVDGIRLSPWKGADRDSWLAARELRAFTPLVFIVRDTDGADPVTVSRTTQLLSGWLAKYDVSFGVVDGAAVESGYLSGSRMAILPYNDVVSDPQMTRLEEFVASGGRLMAHYLLRSRLPALLGFQATGWTQGDFASYALSDAVIRDLPARVAQDSWNITIAAPSPVLNARVIGTWADSTGASTGHPAWLASDNGLFFSHVLLGDDAGTKEYLLLVLIGHHVPGIWPPAADAALAQIGRIAEYSAWDEAVSDIRARGAASPRTAAVERALACADEARREAIARRDAGDYPGSVRTSLEARERLVEAYVLSQTPVEPEFRAVWEHSGTGPWPGDWTSAVDILASNGFTAVFPNMLSGGVAHYDSALLPHSAQYDTHGDQVAACVSAAHARGLEVHAWKVNWNLSGAPRSFVDAMRAAGRTQVAADGTPADWLCPSHPENLALERDSMLEVVRNYDVDGIHFDYIRYPDPDHCYCGGCRSRFEAETGNVVNAWPADVRSGGAVEAAFLDWRRAQITELVEAVHQGVEALRPEVKISAAVFPSYAYCRDGVGQDWVDWIDRGIVDFLCPMDYTEDFGLFRGLVAGQMACAAGRIPVFPGIGATASNSALGPDAVIAQILATREAATGGFLIFNYVPGIAEEHIPDLGRATTAPVGGESDWARLDAAMDVAWTGAIADPAPPRPIEPGDALAWRIVLTETSGVREATEVAIEQLLDDPCLDLSSFDASGVQVAGSSAAVDWDPALRRLAIAGITVPAGAPVGVEIGGLFLSSSGTCTDLCGHATVTWRPRPGNPHTWGKAATGDPEISSCEGATCVWVHPKTYLRKRGVDPALCPLAAPPDPAAIFPLPPTLYVELPWEDPGALLPVADPASPAGNSCLVYYQVDAVDRIRVLRGGTDPRADLRIEAF